MLARPSLRATGFLASKAGPSSRSSPFLAIRFASTTPIPPRVPPRATPHPRPVSTPKSTPFAPRTPVRPPPSTALPTPGKAAWPWRPSLHSPPGYADLERTIYARPFEGPLGNRVRMMWFLVPFWGLVVGFYLTTPGLPEVRPSEAEEGAKVPKETIASTLWYYATPAGMAATSIICFLWLVSPSRFVTRLTQVRRQPISASVSALSGVQSTPVASAQVAAAEPNMAGPAIKEGEFIRMQHGGHLMCWGELERGRELAMEDVKINLLGGGEIRSPYLSLKVPTQRKFSLDSVAYRLDFRDTPVVKASEDEVVLSLSRIEHVFGKIQ